MERWRAHGTALLLGAGSLAVALAGVPSGGMDLERHLVPKALALHSTALLGLGLLLPGTRRVRLGVIDLLLLASLVVSMVSALLAVNRWLAASALGMSLSAAVVFWLGRSMAGTASARWAMAAVAGSAVVASLTGLLQAYGLQSEFFVAERVPGGTFGNRNFLAHYAIIALPALLVPTLGARRLPPRLLGFTGLLIVSAAVALSRSRAAWLAGLGGIAAVALVALRCRAWRLSVGSRGLALTVTAVLAGAALAATLPNRLSWSSESPYRDSLRGLLDYTDGSGRGRVVQYRNSLRLLEDDPVLGVGPGNWFVHYPRVTTPGDPSFAGYDPIPTNPWPSSDWVAFLTERGPAGALLFALAGGAALLVALRRAGQGDPDSEGRSMALSGVLVAVLVAGAFDAVLLSPAPVLLTAALVGLLLPETRPVLDRAPPPRLRVAGAVGSFAALVLLALLSWTQLRSVRVSAPGAAREQLEAASRRDPGNHRLHLRLAARGRCVDRLPHAEAARRLLPFHAYPAGLVKRC